MPRKTLPDRSLAGAAAELASMRPRPDAAENHKCAVPDYLLRMASMRPRPDAAENSTDAVFRSRAPPGLQ